MFVGVPCAKRNQQHNEIIPTDAIGVFLVKVERMGDLPEPIMAQIVAPTEPGALTAPGAPTVLGGLAMLTALRAPMMLVAWQVLMRAVPAAKAVLLPRVVRSVLLNLNYRQEQATHMSLRESGNGPFR
jgi:hypothetical protein